MTIRLVRNEWFHSTADILHDDATSMRFRVPDHVACVPGKSGDSCGPWGQGRWTYLYLGVRLALRYRAEAVVSRGGQAVLDRASVCTYLGALLLQIRQGAWNVRECY